MSDETRAARGQPTRCCVCGQVVAPDASRAASSVACPNCGFQAWSDSQGTMNLDFLAPAAYLSDIGACSGKDAIQKMVAALAACGSIASSAQQDVVQLLWRREDLGSTAIGEGIAIPHAEHAQISRPVGCLARSRAGIDFRSPDGKPVHVVVLLLSPKGRPGDHLRALERVAKWLESQESIRL